MKNPGVNSSKRNNVIQAAGPRSVCPRRQKSQPWLCLTVACPWAGPTCLVCKLQPTLTGSSCRGEAAPARRKSLSYSGLFHERPDDLAHFHYSTFPRSYLQTQIVLRLRNTAGACDVEAGGSFISFP